MIQLPVNPYTEFLTKWINFQQELFDKISAPSRVINDAIKVAFAPIEKIREAILYQQKLIDNAFLPMKMLTQVLWSSSSNAVLKSKALEGIKIDLSQRESQIRFGNSTLTTTIESITPIRGANTMEVILQVIATQEDNYYFREVQTTKLIVENVKNSELNQKVTRRSLEKIKRIVFDKRERKLYLKGKPPITVSVYKKIYDFFVIIFGTKQNLGKEWSEEDLLQRMHLPLTIKAKNSSSERVKGARADTWDRRIYDLCQYINKKVEIKDFVLYCNKSIRINPQYYSLFK